MPTTPALTAHLPLGPAWRHSSFSTGADQTCVDVAVHAADVLVRDSKDPDGPRLVFSFCEWKVFLLGVRAGEFELPDTGAADHPVTQDGRPPLGHSRSSCACSSS